MTGVCLWYRQGLAPVTIRRVLLRYPEDSFKPQAFFCSDTQLPAAQIIAWFIARWNIEVTFEELRAHLGFETQRQWSDKAIERTAPCLFDIFSLVVLLAKVLHPGTLQSDEQVGIAKKKRPLLTPWLLSVATYGAVLITAHQPKRPTWSQFRMPPCFPC